MPTVGLALVLYFDTYLKHTVRSDVKLFLLALTIVNTFVFPLLVMVLLKSRGAIESFHLKKRQERLIPYGISTLFFVFTYNLLSKANLPPLVLSLFLGFSVVAFISFLSSFFTKISTHAMAIAGLLGGVIAMYFKFSVNFSIAIVLLGLVWGLVGYARLTLKAHTQLEFYSGSIIGFFVVFTTIYLGFTI